MRKRATQTGERWEALGGELRSALQARDRGRAGSSVWHMKQHDAARYHEEWEENVRHHVGRGGRMALESEQRLEAVREWGRAGLRHASEDFLPILRALLEGALVRRGCAYGRLYIGERFDLFEGDPTGGGRAGKLLAAGSCLDFAAGLLRADMRDVLWGLLSELDS